MLDRRTSVYQQIFAWQNRLKWLELGMLMVFFSVIFWLVYTSFCSTDICQQFSIQQEQFNLIIQFCFPIAAIINSLRIALVFMLNDNDDQPEYLFYISLFGLALCYSIFGIFFPQFLERSGKFQGDSIIFFVELITLVVTVVSLFSDKQTWDKSVFFVKFRISLCLLHLVVLLINPLIGLLLGMIIVPAMVLMYGGPVREDEV